MHMLSRIRLRRRWRRWSLLGKGHHEGNEHEEDAQSHEASEESGVPWEEVAQDTPSCGERRDGQDG